MVNKVKCLRIVQEEYTTAIYIVSRYVPVVQHVRQGMCVDDPLIQIQIDHH